MKPLACYLRQKLNLKPTQRIVELEKLRSDNCANCFQKQMYEVREANGTVVGIYDTWLLEEGMDVVFGYFQYAPSGDLLDRRTFYLSDYDMQPVVPNPNQDRPQADAPIG